MVSAVNLNENNCLLAERGISSPFDLSAKSARRRGGTAMLDTFSWVTPLLLLPGVGLLLVSTSARFEAVHSEIHQLLDEHSSQVADCAAHVVRRARLLCLAMCGLYVAASALALSGLLAAVTVWHLESVHWVAWLFLAIGVASVLIASLTLTRESTFSLSIVKAHAQEIVARE